MKLTHTHSMKRKSGMTLLELTVVILVLLSLISILFVGARAWKKGSDRSANIMNIRNTQQAMRGHQNLNNVSASAVTGATSEAAFDQAALEEYMKFPADVATVTYEPGSHITIDSPTPATAFTHIWLKPSLDGQPTGTYGHTSFDETTGW